MALAFTLCLAISVAQQTYLESIEQWRQTKEANLKADNGWLTVAGLFWLEPGLNRVGSGDSNPVQLPDGYPKDFGAFERNGFTVTFLPAAVPAKPVPMHSDADGPDPTRIEVRAVTMFVIRRGSRLGVRMRDKNSAMRREFTGLHWYPAQRGYRIEAQWVAYPQPRTIAIPNVLNQNEVQNSLGYAVFQLHGKDHTLEPIVEGNELFYIFKDLTAGKGTYPAGRFLYSEMPVNGKVILDFNKAHNPPCAFTPYATCPLPPPQNRLQAKIEAGERNYGKN